MQDFTIVVKVDAKDAGKSVDAIKRALDGLEQKADQTRSKLGAMLKTAAALEVTRRVVSLADEYVNLRNKLRQVTTSQEELNAVSDATFKIAQDTRQSWSSVASVFSRVRSSTKELGLSMQESLDFTETLSKAIAVSGATAAEANAAMIQLSQGLGSGTLRGDELRSVLEQLPFVADVIAKRLGVTRGEIKKLAEQGKVTSKVVVESFKLAREEIAERFANSMPGVVQSLELVRNAAVKFFGEAATRSGALKGITGLLRVMAENFETVGRAALAASQVIISVFVGRAIRAAIVGMRTLGAAIAANPIGALLLALTATVALLRQFGDKINATGDGITKVSHVFEVAFEAIKRAAERVLDAIADAIAFVVQLFDAMFDRSLVTFENIVLLMANFVDAALKLIVFFKDAIINLFKLIGYAVAESVVDLVNLILRGIEAVVNGAIDAINKVASIIGEELEHVDLDFDNPLAGSVDKVLDDYVAAWERLKDESTHPVADAVKGIFDEARQRAKEEAEKGVIDEADLTGRGSDRTKKAAEERDKLAKALRKLEDSLFPVLAAQRELADAERLLEQAVAARLVTDERAAQILEAKRKSLADALDPYGAWIRKQEEELELLELSAGVRERERAVREAVNSIMAKGVDLTSEQIDKIRQMITLLEEARKRAAEQEEKLRKQREFIDAIVKATKGLTDPDEAARLFNEKFSREHPFAAGMVAGFQSIVDGAADAADAIGRVLAGAVDDMADRLYSFFQTGKFGWRDFANTILQEINRIVFRMLTAQILMAAFGFVPGGSVASGSGGGLLSLLGASAHGTSTMIGGSGGTDSQVFASKVSPGERVLIQTPRQQREYDEGQGRGGGSVVFQPRIINVVDPSQVYSQMSTPRGQRTIMNTLRVNRRGLRAL